MLAAIRYLNLSYVFPGHYDSVQQGLIVQVYILYYSLSKVKSILNENKFFSLEPMLESIPQTHILLCLAGQNPTLIIGKDSTLFVVTFATSFLSAAFALSKFLKTGPCRLVPDVGRLGGFFERGFICLLVNVALTIFIKGAILYAGLQFSQKSGNEEAKWISIYWILLNILPQLNYVSHLQLSYSIYKYLRWEISGFCILSFCQNERI